MSGVQLSFGIAAHGFVFLKTVGGAFFVAYLQALGCVVTRTSRLDGCRGRRYGVQPFLHWMMWAAVLLCKKAKPKKQKTCLFASKNGKTVKLPRKQ